MPIQFRCANCQQLLSVSRRRAGSDVRCPKCAQPTRVPTLLMEAATAEEEADRPGSVSAPPAPEVPAGVPAASPPLAPVDVWQRHPDPWNHPEDDEEDLQIERQPLEEAGLDMTPMVDVTFLLLIFFMITAAFSTQKSLETTAPNPDDSAATMSQSLQELEEESVVVEIDEENRIRVDDEPVSGVAELRDVLSSKVTTGGKREMLLEVHPQASHGTVVAVTDAGLTVQMQRIRRATRRGTD